jgi:uncharacterized protein YegJ (DUF2314 family)
MKQENITLEESYQNARDTFKYFWRELSWEYRRIIPALNIAMVKIAFVDRSVADATQQIEYMWVDNIDFDGKYISGVLVNQPNWLTNISQGDSIKVELKDLSDWMFTVDTKVYGAFFVNQMRANMSEEERKEHDDMWGLDFGDPEIIELAIYENEDEEHPMSLNMAKSTRENLEKSTQMLEYRDEIGGTMLHYDALAGNLAQVEILLEYGLDPEVVNLNGDKAIDLARRFKWDKIVKVLE